MKHIKTYEKIKESVFYYIPYSDSEFVKMAIKKIPTEQRVINDILNNMSLINTINMYEPAGIFIGIHNKLSHTDWEFGISERNKDYKSNYDLFINDDYQFGGEIKLEDWEIAANKYNI